jgi:uracil-DNA glycosylase family 4
MTDGLLEQLGNYLKLLELSGTSEILLPAVPSADLAGALACAGGWAERAAAKAGAGATDASTDGLSGGGIESLRLDVEGCRACELHQGRTNVVFGEGNPSARLMFVGEGPGADEDAQGRPFVGRAGALLTKIIQAMGISRDDVYIANVVKCRPPGNRTPEPDEISSCLPYLEKQIALVRPEVICTLGNVATRTLAGEHRPISEMRLSLYAYRGIDLVPTFHPAACLRNPDSKKDVWEDIKKVMKLLGLPIRGVKTDGAGTNRN